jgi:ATP-binding cassette subfamily F protein uup
LPVASPARRKLSYKEQRELAELPGTLEGLENRRAELAERSADPSFYQQPRATVAADLATLAELDAQIEAAFARWAELEGG